MPSLKATGMETQLIQRIEAFVRLGAYMQHAMNDPEFLAVAKRAESRNPLFTISNIQRAVRTWGATLRWEAMYSWLEPYLPDWPQEKRCLALVMAGNIPIVGFHDYLCGVLCGYRLQIKLSSKDPLLLPFLHEKLLWLVSGQKIQAEEKEGRMDYPESGCIPQVSFTASTVRGFDAIIATGSGNTFRYFEYYFGRYPHLLRRNRVACALIDGNENRQELAGLADDVLAYFGMGCRNVSKLYIPENYDFAPLLDALEPVSSTLASHAIYKDNYDYHKAVCMVNRQAFLDNGSILLQQSVSLASPMGVIYYETYKDKSEADTILAARQAEIQCVVGRGRIPFGKAQSPGLTDYADGVDILKFLIHL